MRPSMTEGTVVAPHRRIVWTVWGIGAAAYTVSILNRTSLSAVGVDAAERFHADAATLSLFAVMQLMVYGALQIPVGLLLDRFGPRGILCAGMLLMAAGQAVMAYSPDLEIAVGARVLLGAGDACIFPAVLRLIAAWFPARKAPPLIQTTGLIGQFGQLLSAAPLAAFLHATSWETAFTSVAATGALFGALALALVRNSPTGTSYVSTPKCRVRRGIIDSWRHPGTRLAFWSHFSTPFAGTAFALLWGYPFLTAGQGLDTAQAGVVFFVYVLFGIIAGPLLGTFSARHPLRRSWLVLLVVAVQASAWLVVILWPGPAPFGLLLLLAMALCTGGPGSMIAFDFTRAHNPATRLSTATGMVNTAGFTAGVLAVFAIGLIMNLQHSGTPETYNLEAFKLAFLAQFPIWAVGTIGILRERRRTRAALAASGITIRPIKEVLAARRVQGQPARKLQSMEEK